MLPFICCKDSPVKKDRLHCKTCSIFHSFLLTHWSPFYNKCNPTFLQKGGFYSICRWFICSLLLDRGKKRLFSAFGPATYLQNYSRLTLFFRPTSFFCETRLKMDLWWAFYFLSLWEKCAMRMTYDFSILGSFFGPVFSLLPLLKIP